jgi:hypothetical protein
VTPYVFLALLGLAALAFTYGCAKAEGIGWPADLAAGTAAASMALSAFLWEHDWTAGTGCIGCIASIALVAMGMGWWKP